jgi:hypothetical protein
MALRRARRWAIAAVLAATASCGSLIGLEAPINDLSADGEAGLDAASAAEGSIAPNDAGGVADGNGVDANVPARLECRTSPLVGRGDEQPMPPLPLVDGGGCYGFGVAIDEIDDSTVGAYVSVGGETSGSNGGTIYRSIDGGYELFAKTPTASKLRQSGRYLFASSFTGATPAAVWRYPLDCVAPCASGEQVTQEAVQGTPIDAIWPSSEDVVYVVPYIGNPYRLTRGTTQWSADEIGTITLPSSYRSAAMTSGTLYVAQVYSSVVQPFPLSPGASVPPSPTMPNDGGAIVVADCDHLYGLNGNGVISFDPATGVGTPLGFGSFSFQGTAVDESFLYISASGLVRYPKKQGAPAEPTPQLAGGQDVYGVAVSAHWIYYSDHGDGTRACTLARRPKTLP